MYRAPFFTGITTLIVIFRFLPRKAARAITVKHAACQEAGFVRNPGRLVQSW
jgi:hypothetical protein